MHQTKKVFHWIVGILRKYKIPFHISGGLAAKVYGSNRSLADIDIEIPNDAINLIISEIEKYIIYDT